MIYILKTVEKLIFNGIDVEYELIGENNTYDSYFIINNVYGRGIEGVENNLISVPGRDGVYSAYTYRPPRYLNVSVTIKGTSFHDLRKKLERLSSILNTDGKNVPIKFGDELDRIYYGKLDQVSGDYEKSHIYQAVITFICPDPYKYSTTEKNLLFPADVVTIENNGTAEALPIFELEATQKTTFTMVSNQDDEYNLVGQPADVDEQVVDLRNLIFYEHGETLDDWTTSGTAVDGTVAGSFGSDGDGITVKGYGTDTKDWHGPALIREIDPITDFEIEAMVEGRTTDVSQTFRIEFYLFDENMNQLGKMAILDRNTNINEKQAEARLGPFSGLHENYFISSRNYKHRQDFWFGMLRMRRVGNKFDFYVTRIDNRGRHVYSLLETYIDVNNDYSGRLKYVQIHIGKYSDTERAYGPKFNRLRVYELAKETQDKTPYILYPGDILEFDHVEKDIRLNGESRKDLKNFGASFFTLKKGENRLVVTPENSFRTRVKFRERYL